MPTAAADTYVIDRLDPYLNPEKARLTHVPMAVGTYAKGTLLGRVTSGGLFKLYATGNSDGSETARVILQYACVVDASNNITIADGSGVTQKTAPAYMAGQGCGWKTTDLTTLDAPGLADMYGLILHGDITTGVVII